MGGLNPRFILLSEPLITLLIFLITLIMKNQGNQGKS